MSHDLSHVREFSTAGGRVFVAPMKTKDVVAVEGSVLGGPNFFLHNHEMVSIIAAELLDAGTNKHSKNAIREALAQRGATLSFAAGGDRLLFSAQCFPEDLSYVLGVIVDCLRGANFPEKEIKTGKTRELGKIREEKSDTNTQASIALSRLLYDPLHVNYDETLEVLEKQIQTVRRQTLAAFRNQLGCAGLILSITGDTTAEAVQTVVEKAFRRLSKGTLAPITKKRNAKTPAVGEKRIVINDKANIDVYLGVALPLVKSDTLYHPLALVSEMLGGGFASHLMQTVRERDGLTYRTYAKTGGFADGADGYFEVYASFNPERYGESIDTLRREVHQFFTTGITKEALARKKEEVAGSYLVSLATTRGLARVLHQLGVDNRPLTYLKEYPEIIRAISLAEAHRAADLIPLSRLSLAAAGTFPKK